MKQRLFLLISIMFVSSCAGEDGNLAPPVSRGGGGIEVRCEERYTQWYSDNCQEYCSNNFRCRDIQIYCLNYICDH